VQLGVYSSNASGNQIAHQNNKIEGGDYDVSYNDEWTTATQSSYSSKGLPGQLDGRIITHAMTIIQLNLYGCDVANLPVYMPQMRTIRLQVNYIGDNAFEKSPNLEAIIINPQSNNRSTTISPLAFAKLSNLQKIYMPRSMLESYLSSGTIVLKPFTGCNLDCKIYTDRDAFYDDDDSSPGYLGKVRQIRELNLQGLRPTIGPPSANLTPQYPAQSPSFNQTRALTYGSHLESSPAKVEEIPTIPTPSAKASFRREHVRGYGAVPARQQAPAPKKRR
jgi:hypothetical protein